MDRRHFMAASSLAAASPMLVKAAAISNSSASADGLFKRVDFSTDGLGLNPAEYTHLLHDVATSANFKSDYYSNGGHVAELEQKFAKLLGKEAAMFVPTGTLANHLAIRKLAGQDRRVLVQAESHLYNDSGDGAETLSGLNLIPLALGKASLELAEIKSWVERSAGGRVPTKVGVISIESPVRRKNHEHVDFAELERISQYAREKGIRLHLDGARLFNLPLHTGKSIQQYAALFDTSYVSLWKHFNGASGAILAGDASFIDGLYHTRRMFGGSLPYAWPQVALVTQYVDNYEAEYSKAWKATDRLIELLAADARFKIEKVPNGTSRFLLTVSGIGPEVFAEKLSKQDVMLPHPPPRISAFQMQVNSTILRRAPEKLAKAFIGAMES